MTIEAKPVVTIVKNGTIFTLSLSNFYFNFNFNFKFNNFKFHLNAQFEVEVDVEPQIMTSWMVKTPHDLG